LLLLNSVILLYAQYGVVLGYDFLLGSLNILIIFFCVSVVFSHTESSFAWVLFLFVFNGVALQVLQEFSFSLFICVEQKNKCFFKG